MSIAEFPFPVPLARLSAAPAGYSLAASAAQCRALAARFDLIALDSLEAALAVSRTADGAAAEGRLRATATQRCVVSGAPVAVAIDQPVLLCFRQPPRDAADIELDAEAADAILIEGDSIDLGEAVAQTLALLLDPWPRADVETIAAARRHLLSEEEAQRRERAEQAAAHPFSVLKRADD